MYAHLSSLRCLTAGLLLVISEPLVADDWPAPKTREVFSQSREYFVRILPGESVGDSYGFAGAKKGRYATAEFYRRSPDRSYRLAAEASLVNPVAPVEFFVSDAGRLATVDNWHNRGYGKVVAIYGADGKLLRAYELVELFDPTDIQGFVHSVSSIYWRNGPLYIRQDQKTLLVTVKPGADFLFGLETGHYKYCEFESRSHRCRGSTQPGRWTTNAEAPLTR
jgi:hypothetical protein